ncbi:hypothetical protein BpHYR1_023965 [Brachionus plicatilis]|uniref:Uncharacterized protein n=1 Tax=Brachionus plicatilis TaxID=10195 RepID=A0A3M7SPK6_BRAPC|nr:hypothetical protein BpHYR1_023965 [Brachionus plicatilis]
MFIAKSTQIDKLINSFVKIKKSMLKLATFRLSIFTVFPRSIMPHHKLSYQLVVQLNRTREYVLTGLHGMD